MAKVRKRPYPEVEEKSDKKEEKSDKDKDKEEKERAVTLLKQELTSSLGGIRTEVRSLAQQVTALADADAGVVARPAAPPGSAEDTRTLRKVMESLEQRMTRKLTQIDERLARGPRSSKSGPSGQRSRPPAAAEGAAIEGGGGRRRRTAPPVATQGHEFAADEMTC